MRMVIDIRLGKVLAHFQGGWGVATLADDGTVWSLYVVTAVLNEQNKLETMKGFHDVSVEVMTEQFFGAAFEAAIMDMIARSQQSDG